MTTGFGDQPCTPDDEHASARKMLSQKTSYIVASGCFFTLHNVYDARSHEHQICSSELIARRRFETNGMSRRL
jgi:hypothetical protein